MEGIVVLAVLFLLGYPFFAAWIFGAGRAARIDLLENQVRALRKTIDELTRQGTAAPENIAPPAATQPANAAETPEPAERAAVEPIVPAAPVDQPAVVEEAGPISQQAAIPPAHAATPAPAAAAFTAPRWWLAVKRWLFTGNLVAKLGLVILFIGVGFLLKYVAETVTIPIQVRLAGVVFADLFLLAWGWRIRDTRRGVGLPVQGTAIAILMLVVFGAFHNYGLIPSGAAFLVLVVLTAFTCLLAVLQDAIWLAAFGITGGFACPLLLATGEGNYIGLFSYYALLNAGVFALALKRAWRMLNLIGFAFTFVVGAAWGGLKYGPDNYQGAQSFLILFFLFYVAIALAFARQQQTRLKNYVDATLVLGTPLLAFGLQVGLVRNKPFGLALSSLAMGAFYLGLAVVLWRRAREQYRMLVETFLALGVVFASLAIPFALEGRWTSGVWALEGAGFVWLGLRQGKVRVWGFGLLLQLGAWYSFILAASGLDPAAAAESNLWLGFLLLAGSTFGIATSFRKHREDGKPRQTWLANGFLVMAAVWLQAGLWVEIMLRAHGSLLGNLLVAGAIVTAIVLNVIASQLEWRLARRLALVAQLAGAGALAVVSGMQWDWFERYDLGGKPVLGAMIISVAALVTSRSMQRGLGEQADMKLSVALLWWGGFWWFGPLLNVVSEMIADHVPPALGTVSAAWKAAYALCVAASALGFARIAHRFDWAAGRWLSATCWAVLVLASIRVLDPLYNTSNMPYAVHWMAWAGVLAASEYLLSFWAAREWRITRIMLETLHGLRLGGPWLAIWPAGAILVSRWLADTPDQQALMASAGWGISAAWSNYLPTWAMILVLTWLMRRTRQEKWPATPLSDWYRAILIPCGVAFLVLLVIAWNFTQDGTMAPLPYLPLLNPLDLTTGFVVLAGIGASRLLAVAGDGNVRRMNTIRVAAAGASYLWFNLMLLRSAAHYLGIAYAFDALMASQFVQALLSLVWTCTALVLMRHAATHERRKQWSVGAALLVVVVAKLFIADLGDGGSMARVITFVGVGLLMVLIGYLAPYPKAGERQASGNELRP